MTALETAETLPAITADAEAVAEAPVADVDQALIEITPDDAIVPVAAPAASQITHHERRAKRARHHHASPRKAPVTPRRIQPIDPDGTLDPYL